MDSASWLIKIIDEATGPAKAISKLVEEARGAFEDLTEASDKLTEPLKDVAKAADEAAGSAKDLSQATSPAVGITGDLAGALKVVGPAAGVAAAAVLAMATGAVAVATYQFAKATLEAATFADKVRGTFTALSGGATNGTAELKEIRAVALAVERPLEEVRQTFSTFVSAGVSNELSSQLTKLTFDFRQMGAKGNEAAEAVLASINKATVGVGEFEAVAKAAGGKDALGSALGLSREALANTTDGAALLAKELAQIDPTRFAQVVAASREAVAPLGSVSAAAGSFVDKFDAVKADIFQEIVEQAGITTGSFDGLIDKFAEIAKSPEAIEMMRDLGDTLYWLGATAVDVGKFIADNWGVISAVLKVVGVSFLAVGAVIGAVVGVLAVGAASIVGLFMAPIAIVGAAMAAIVAFGALVWETASNVVTGLTGLVPKFIEIGGSLMSGLIDGIAGGLTKLIAKVQDVGSAVIGAAKDALGIHSPSKEFAELGQYSTEGFIQGLDKSLPALERSIGLNLSTGLEGFTPPKVAVANDTSAAVATQGTATTSSGTVVHVSVSVNLVSSGNAQADAVAIGQSLEGELAAVFERLAS